MRINRLKNLLKGLRDAFKFRSWNPLFFQLAASQPISVYEDFYLISKIKHEVHLLEKAIKNPYSDGRAHARKLYADALLAELKSRKLDCCNIIIWAEEVLLKYNTWKSHKLSQHIEGQLDFQSLPELSVPSIRFWEAKKPPQQDILDCIATAQMAPASCNRQSFLIKVQVNDSQNFEDLGARNGSMFEAAPYRIFIFVNLRNYTEKYSAFIDMGMFAQNFILQAKKIGLGCCCCYASEHLEGGQSKWRDKFELNADYYCGLSILVGYPKELVEKPPRLNAQLITEFREK